MAHHPGNKLIFGNPRSGTKLLAEIFQARGYHNFGEFFNSFNTDVLFENEIPYAVRATQDDQRFFLNLRKTQGIFVNDHYHRQLMRDRFKLFNQFKSITPSILTVWDLTFQLVPETFNLTNDRYILCTRRNNKFEQLLSRSITRELCNYNGESVSTPILINKDEFHYYFRSLVHVEQLQDHFVQANQGRVIDFDKLIAGTEDLGFSYIVNTQDQHTNLESLIINLSDIQIYYTELISKYKVAWD